MIAVDTSTLMAIVLGEPQAEACMTAIEEAEQLLISGLGFEIVTVTAASARRIADAYGRWGKGIHPASLNYGDCFAYEVAIEHDCPLLYIGDDFRQTDVRSAL